MSGGKSKLAGLNKCIALLLLLAILLANSTPFSLAQEEEEAFVSDLMAGMSVAEKVGQLFIVAFPGNKLSSDAEITHLIQEYRIGGVLLLASNDNFTNSTDTPRQVLALTNGLQSLALNPPNVLPAPTITSTELLTSAWNPLPLFVAIDYEGDGHPYTPLRSGMTAVPNNMALGATWDENNALAVGRIVGQELEAVGVNMLLGPSLDVLERPRPSLAGDLGTRTFGGDPYWVGKMGRAYVRGVHEGSDRRVAVVAKHFPGLGGSDRRPDEEVATVQKSLEQLRQIELAPFFAVTQQPATTDTLPVSDALMTSHIRYRGFQGNIRQLTRPISFDAQNLPAILALPEFQPWRQAGGVLVANSLGQPAVKKFYDPTLQSFNAKRVAQEAFLAGNDLLILSEFGLTDEWPEQLENVKATIQFFQEKYVSDPDFRARVDDAVRRIIRLKHRLYGEFTLAAVRKPLEGLADRLGQGEGEMAQVAKSAITLIYPGAEELADRLPGPPLGDENILFFTDDRQAQDCPICPPFYYIKPLELQNLVLQLYGPEGSGQVDPERIHSFTFSQLKTALDPANADRPETAQIEEFTRQADWIIFAMLDINVADHPQSDAVRVFLKSRSDSLRGKKIVVVAYNAPYYLDTTEISKLTAYYGAYSKTPAALEASVRTLFQEFNPSGSPPVSVESINYDLIRRMEPDPNQVIPIEVVSETAITDTVQPTPGLTPMEPASPVTLDIQVGDTLRLRTGVILDRNGHPVPDGTPAVFRLLYPAEALELPRKNADTVNGVAETEITLERTGQMEVTVSSAPAERSVIMIVTVQEEEGATIATVIPPPTATATPAATPTTTPTSEPSPTPTQTLMPTPTASAEEPPTSRRLDGWDLLLSSVSIIMAGTVLYLRLGGDWRSQAERMRFFLWSLSWGLVGYISYGLNWFSLRRLPWIGAALFQRLPQWLELVLVCLLFASLPLLFRWGWGYVRSPKIERLEEENQTETE
jgi:beta-N-acetylhexosaminidase